VRGLPQEKDQIERALADYKTALGLYQGIAPYGDSTAQITRLQNDMESVQTRLQQLEAPDPATAAGKVAEIVGAGSRIGRLLKALVGKGNKTAAPPPAPGVNH
jgi:hypothetical protein